MDPKTLPPADKEALRRHIYGTYLSLRYGMAAIAFAFPLLLYVAGKLNGLPLQGSMSAYYWASNGGDPPVRVWFVGGLFAIGSFLYLYKGFTDRENIALNLAALFAIGVAYFPMSWNCGSDCPNGNLHGTCAFALFACLAYVALFRSRDTLPALQDPALERRYRNLYSITSALMLFSPVAAIVLHALFQKYNALTFFLELCGIYAFALFWLIKSLEMSHSQAEEQALRGASGPAEPDNKSGRT